MACEDLGTSVIRTVSDRVGIFDDELSEHLIPPARLRDHDERLLVALEPEPGVPARTAREAVTSERGARWRGLRRSFRFEGTRRTRQAFTYLSGVFHCPAVRTEGVCSTVPDCYS